MALIEDGRLMKKIRIAIELNGVIRNINKQILKYYQKDYDRTIDLDEADEKDDPFKLAKFNSEHDKFNFLHVDYPFEIFGCAKPMESILPVKFNEWLALLSDDEECEYEVLFFSMHETSLSVQSSYFFLSKIGARVRKILFPMSYDELAENCDMVITSSVETINSVKDVYKVLINMTYNKGHENEADAAYDSMTSVIDLKQSFLDGIKEHLKEKTGEDDE